MALAPVLARFQLQCSALMPCICCNTSALLLSSLLSEDIEIPEGKGSQRHLGSSGVSCRELFSTWVLSGVRGNQAAVAGIGGRVFAPVRHAGSSPASSGRRRRGGQHASCWVVASDADSQVRWKSANSLFIAAEMVCLLLEN